MRPSDQRSGKQLLGTTVGRYFIEAELGSGGMGTVYRAEQIPLDRRVALKLIHDHHAKDERVRSRFLREAKIASALTNPNTVTIYEFGQAEDGRLYLAMELLIGESLRDALSRPTRIDPVAAAQIGAAVCRSLIEAHRKGIVHRDLKPDNIFLCAADDGPVLVKVLDYGLARILGNQDALSSDGMLTQVGAILGTPDYLSPEQARGGTVDGRCDLYSLGIVLYEMLTGVTPFHDDDVVHVLGKQLRDPPPPMGSVGWGIAPPTALEDLVTWLLQKKPGDRPPDASTVHEELRRFLGETGGVLGSIEAPPSLLDTARLETGEERTETETGTDMNPTALAPIAAALGVKKLAAAAKDSEPPTVMYPHGSALGRTSKIDPDATVKVVTTDHPLLQPTPDPEIQTQTETVTEPKLAGRAERPRTDPTRKDALRADPLRADALRADALRADALRADALRADALRADARKSPDSSASQLLVWTEPDSGRVRPPPKEDWTDPDLVSAPSAPAAPAKASPRPWTEPDARAPEEERPWLVDRPSRPGPRPARPIPSRDATPIVRASDLRPAPTRSRDTASRTRRSRWIGGALLAACLVGLLSLLLGRGEEESPENDDALVGVSRVVGHAPGDTAAGGSIAARAVPIEPASSAPAAQAVAPLPTVSPTAPVPSLDLEPTPAGLPSLGSAFQLGAPTQGGWSGSYGPTDGPAGLSGVLKLTQEGDTVRGTFGRRRGPKVTLEGQAEGAVLRFRWQTASSDSDSVPPASGHGVLGYFVGPTDRYNMLHGTWGIGDASSGGGIWSAMAADER